MPSVTLSWEHAGVPPDQFNIYRSLSPMDPEAMPLPLNNVAGGLREYVDATVTEGTTYYWRVGALLGTMEKISPELEFKAQPSDVTDSFDTDTSSLYTKLGLNTTASIGDGFLTFTVGGTDDQTVWARTGVNITDGRVGVTLDQANDAGLAFRIVDANNYYVAIICDHVATVPPTRNKAGIWRRLGGTWFQLGVYVDLPGGFTRGTLHKFEVEMEGSTFRVYFDDTLIMTRTDSSHASGMAGPRANRRPCRFASYSYPRP